MADDAIDSNTLIAHLQYPEPSMDLGVAVVECAYSPHLNSYWSMTRTVKLDVSMRQLYQQWMKEKQAFVDGLRENACISESPVVTYVCHGCSGFGIQVCASA